jgi:hypothetical protein
MGLSVSSRAASAGAVEGQEMEGNAHFRESAHVVYLT